MNFKEGTAARMHLLLYPITGTLPGPIIAGAAMSLSSAPVIFNVLRLGNLRLR